MNAVTLQTLQQHKLEQQKFAVITSYDATFSRLIEAAGIEVILVGDSLGNVLQGHDSTLPVTVEDICYHTACVKRAINRPLLISDLPFASYATPEQAYHNAARLMQAGAHVVKMEGGEWLLDSIHFLTERAIPVCGHLGLTPQSVNQLGGYKVQGRDQAGAEQILRDARAIEAAGASLLVLECVPAALGQAVAEALQIPVIGIGAGAETDAQVLVLHDLLGLSARPPRFVKNFLTGHNSVQDALSAYNEAVQAGSFPAEEHCFR